MKHWQISLIGGILGVIIVYFTMPYIDKISQNFMKGIIRNIKPIRIQFFENLRKKKSFKPNLFIIELFVFICIFISIFSGMNLREIKIQSQLAQREYSSTDLTGQMLNKSLINMTEKLNLHVIEFLVINVCLLALFIYKRADALLITSMANNFKKKKLSLLKTSISEKDFVMFDFKWGSINSFDDYNNLCYELDNCLNKVPVNETTSV